MLNKKNREVIQAVETLEDIAELDFERDVYNADREEIEEHNRQVAALTAKMLNLKNENLDTTVKALRGTFHTILKHIQNFYKQDYRQRQSQEAVEGIKDLMATVGEAVERLDKYTTLFKKTKEKSVTNLKEYKQLQDFYLNRIARKIDQGVLGKWILELAKESMSRNEVEEAEVQTTTQTKHIFIDLQTVRKDSEYELFFLKKEDGTRFFSPKLIRNIKLVCDFEKKIGKTEIADPLEDLQKWEDVLAFESARSMVRFLQPTIAHFYNETRAHAHWDIVREVNKTLMALLLSSNHKNLLNHSVKSCYEYFNDFLGFLRETMLSKEYAKWIAYPPKKTNKLAYNILDTIHQVCLALMTSNRGISETTEWVNKLIGGVELEEGKIKKEEAHYTWSKLLNNYLKLNKLLKKHPNGPLIKVLNTIKQGGYYAFDPISQFNIPEQLYSLYLNENRITNLRMPSPTFQEYIQKSLVIEEFKGFLRTKQKHLLINLQDRTSWREHFRSKALEELQDHPEFEKNLVVVTLSKDTEFYEQTSLYQQENHAGTFLKHFKEQLMDENCGFYFPKSIKKQIFPKFINETLSAIHTIFFSDKNVLTAANRRDFIEIFYLFLTLKLIDIVQPNSFSFTCKDGVDVGPQMSAELYVLLELIRGESVDIQKLNAIIELPAILIRERAMLPDRFNRMLDAIKLLEYAREEYGAAEFPTIIKEGFELFYKSPILSSEVIG